MQSKRFNKFSNRAESQFPKLTTHSISKACNSFHLSISIEHKFPRHFQFSPQTNNSIYTDRPFALSKTNQYKVLWGKYYEDHGGCVDRCKILLSRSSISSTGASLYLCIIFCVRRIQGSGVNGPFTPINIVNRIDHVERRRKSGPGANGVFLSYQRY